MQSVFQNDVSGSVSNARIGSDQAAAFIAFLLVALLVSVSRVHGGTTSDALFRDGLNAYRNGDYTHAALAFRAAAARRPAAGTLQDLGLAEWQQGRTGIAVLAWEQALWLDPFNRAARTNLRYARKNAQLEAPELTWYEVASSWLPGNWWAWSASLSLWLAMGMGTLPGVFRVRKASWHQAVAALGLAVFLLSLPAQLGLETRSRIGFVLEKDSPLRLTPTDDAQFITRLSAGDPVRVERTHGRYRLVRTSRTLGWLDEGQFALICPGSR